MVQHRSGSSFAMETAGYESSCHFTCPCPTPSCSTNPEVAFWQDAPGEWLWQLSLFRVVGAGCLPGHISDEGTSAWPSWAAAAAVVKTEQPRVEAQGWKQCAVRGDAEVAPEQSGSPLALSGSAANSTIQSLELGRGTPASPFLFRTCICPTLTSLPKGFTHMCGILKER